MRMPSRMLPLTFLAMSTAVMTRPRQKRMTLMPAVLKVPSATLPVNEMMETRVAWLETTRPELLRPMMVMNRPMPAEMAYLRLSGMASKILSRRLVRDITAKTAPSRKMAASATSQL